MRTDELDYDLPPGLVATDPPPERDGGRLLVVPREGGVFSDRLIVDLVELLPSNALLVVNDTRVLPARLRGTKSTGGKAEFLLLESLDAGATMWHAFGRASKPMRPGAVVGIDEELRVEVIAKRADGSLEVRLHTDDPMRAIERAGEVPLPPYLGRAPRDDDRERYQTVYASQPGAVAAPTAGLHLSATLLAALARKGVERCAVTLHVGAGTFAPVQVDDLDAHPMHAERFEIPDSTADAIRRAREARRPVVAVGTTVVRALETWGGDLAAARSGHTRLLIQPGFSFRVVDELLTNFHLPRSTLLALVMAFAKVETVRSAYAHAIAERYRFYSYGDAMLLR